MRGQQYGEVICAGVSAVKWKANKEPEQDWARIQELLDVLQTIQAKRFILISTIDVYAITAGLDESFDCGSVDNHAYGRHRLAVEAFCRKQFAECYIIRLPGLFVRRRQQTRGALCHADEGGSDLVAFRRGSQGARRGSASY